MLEIAPNRAAPVKILRGLLGTVAKTIQPACQGASHLGLQLAFDLLNHLPDDPSRSLEHFALEMAAKGQEGLEQLHVRLEFFKCLLVRDQFGQAVTVERML